uniref:Anthranilate synthase component 2 n=1 Tax=Taenioma perpusillum TaxID=210852 RepID=A0A1Z1MRI0_9FLOR|nr:Anthranilate synthase component II [Taenioma perpusillum]ARW68432.1 Anthranilate synthase component II [Taenioma perpusillum]
MITIIDNYDSFTENLVQYVGELGFEIKIIRNDEMSLKNLLNNTCTHIILSPGPGHPKNSGICLEILSNYANRIPILGVCLGHQAIGYIYGAKVKQLDYPVHGKTSRIFHNEQDIFKKLPNPFIATRYHSLAIDEIGIPENLEITAWSKTGTIMACQHKNYKKLRGVQFHPESLWTCQGKKVIKNFLST